MRDEVQMYEFEVLHHAFGGAGDEATCWAGWEWG